MNMKKCSHCQAEVNPLRLLLVTRWTPYQCPTCAQRFQRVLRPSSWLLYGIPFFLLFGVALWWHFSLISMGLVVIGGALINMMLDWLVIPWRRLNEG
jgi:DNA-directed RNA polymerase subunit RPC12/RpoP